MNNYHKILVLALTIIALITISGCTENIAGGAYSFGTVKTCSDSDGGINHAEKGIVRFGGNQYTDYCSDKYTLRYEYYCDKNSIKYDRDVNCPNGCNNGACIEKAGPYCIDNDNGLDYNAASYVEGIYDDGTNYKLSDYCVDNAIIENYCGALNPGVHEYECPYGCRNGGCITP